MTPAARLPTFFAFVVITAMTVLLVVPGVALSAPAGCRDPSPYTTDPGTFRSTGHPLVLVHGLQSNSDSLGQVESEIEQRVPGTFDFRYFDYRRSANDWVVSPRIAACLADYLHAVSAAHRASGGDGRVYVVAHSMGGLATRFASSADFVPHPVSAEVLAGMVTIDTPHRGSPFGGSIAAQWASNLTEWFNWARLPGRTSDATKCLAEHGPTKALPASCATPPYLDPGTKLLSITGTTVLSRSVLGVHLYDVDLRSDAVVSPESARDYLGSGRPGSTAPVGTDLSFRNISCTQDTSATTAILRAASPPTPGSLLRAVVLGIGFLYGDSVVFDDLAADRQGEYLAALRLGSYLTSPCGHSAMLHNDQAMDAAAEALRSWTTPRVVPGGFAGVVAGDPEADARAAAGPLAEIQDGNPCTLVGLPETYQPPYSVGYQIDNRTGTVNGVYPPAEATTAEGLGRGATVTDVRGTYGPAGLEFVYAGISDSWVALVPDRDDPDLTLGFVFPATSDTTPPGPSVASDWLVAGSREFTLGYELCSDAILDEPAGEPGGDALFRTFTTPDGSVSCYAAADTDLGEARCDVVNAMFSPPPRPASCTGDWGSSILVTGPGDVGFMCATDSAYNSDIVPVGTVITSPSADSPFFRCVVESVDTVSCVQVPVDRGFRISPTGFEILG
ncbi:triacylglycerol lipase [Klenkia sp. PcliD-1-E]|uniref:esterase/lipase family protein n=1 Tax=Klenkia sp. PcliD-1-E TaxID=2954492 RepID=UPI0020971253|nr:hypothetical protein [Klenkia sp. PcliD-1-E]MCO7219365.1 hypothetical protein [Klenkia sp. PcliD-1-E]